MRGAGTAAATQASVSSRYRCAAALSRAFGPRGLRSASANVRGAQPNRLRFLDDAHSRVMYAGDHESRERAPLQLGGALDQRLLIAGDSRFWPLVSRFGCGLS